MKIVSFVEGARVDAGGVGLVGVPHICRAVAEQGHEVILNICGEPMPNLSRLTRPVSKRPGAFKVLTFAARGRWAFAPLILWKLRREIKEADFITLHSLYSFPVLAGYCLARCYNKPYGLWPHGVLAPFQRQVSARKKELYNRLIARPILDKASVLFYSAQGERTETLELQLKAPSVIVPHGIDLEECRQLPARGQFRSKYFEGYQGTLLLYLGRLNAKKGLELLIEAFAKVAQQDPEVRLALVGGGDPPKFAEQIKRLIIQSGLQERIVMTGVLTSSEKLSALADADLFVLPSHAENFAFAMFEAMASRLPVVISETLNLATEVVKNETGRAVPREPAAFAAAILELIDNEPLRRQMGENGFRLAQAYSWTSTGERVEKTIQAIIEGESLPAELSLL